MQHAHAREVLAVTCLVFFVAASRFTSMFAAEAWAINNVQFELSSQGQAELHVFSTHPIISIETKSLKVLTANHHGGAGDCWYWPWIPEHSMVLRTDQPIELVVGGMAPVEQDAGMGEPPLAVT